jgi:hypothetical protein
MPVVPSSLLIPRIRLPSTAPPLTAIFSRRRNHDFDIVSHSAKIGGQFGKEFALLFIGRKSADEGAILSFREQLFELCLQVLHDRHSRCDANYMLTAKQCKEPCAAACATAAAGALAWCGGFASLRNSIRSLSLRMAPSKAIFIVCWWKNSEKYLFAASISPFDPQRTLATCARNYAGMGALRSGAV